MEETMAAGGAVPDILGPGLAVLFVGYNPGRYSGAGGHHFAGPGNLFWALLYESGLTGQRLSPERDHELLLWHLGVTNLVARVTPGSADLTVAELAAGADRLRSLLRRWRPRAVAFLGKDLYRAYAGWSASRPVEWGLQPVPAAPGVGAWVLPNPSRRSTVPYGLRLHLFRRLAEVVAAPAAESPSPAGL
ncbi:G:T/U mismatch-specific uracil/thymine DNA-glycosylase [Candidatus Hydrogenisulfobacillus filiaventi]|uniref:G:T/U mismatch-specific uracil/thymine DNA-glycosylase n=1 Tax=Candidatus Hydrogenisulfobacillus filiaventi TaxID=2707344 RepID=A0A6F8ZKL2_9FIRM|nr:mismatch-specific DNA-glycosylase [Bacillota bacterium]CAB1130223.1 G:T/U mismatch-specific uracil/thymine DNA-glycosylase [Candidatus Hydrogenisulfobacillus filiaventi]